MHGLARVCHARVDGRKRGDDALHDQAQIVVPCVCSLCCLSVLAPAARRRSGRARFKARVACTSPLKCRSARSKLLVTFPACTSPVQYLILVSRAWPFTMQRKTPCPVERHSRCSPAPPRTVHILQLTAQLEALSRGSPACNNSNEGQGAAARYADPRHVLERVACVGAGEDSAIAWASRLWVGRACCARADIKTRPAAAEVYPNVRASRCRGCVPVCSTVK